MMEEYKYKENICKVFNNTKYNINVSAVAGSGKTTLLLDLLKLVPKEKSCSFFAFNNSIVDELIERNTRSGIHIVTLHSYGWHSILRRYGKVKMNKNKVLSKTEKLFKKYPEIKEKRKGWYFYAVPKVVDLMRSNLSENTVEAIQDICDYYDLNVNEFDIKFIQEAFNLVIKDKNQFDFADMIYQPVIDSTIRCHKFDFVFCDESQDFSTAQQALIKKSINRNGRLITVGDPSQAIYGFAGADADSYDNLSGINGKTVTMPLSVCYRCGIKIVEEAKKIVPQIQWHKNAIEGKVYDGSLMDIQYGDWVICRNLKPLIQTYLWLLKNKIKSKVRGRDICEGLIQFINKIGTKDLDKFQDGMEREREKLHKRLLDKGVKTPSQHPKMEILENKIEVLEFLCSEVNNVIQLKALINDIFSDDKEGIILSTIHKSKGLENKKVFFLLPELIPSKYAIQDWQLEQEMNLKYVCITRAKEELVYVDKKSFQTDIQTNINLYGK